MFPGKVFQPPWKFKYSFQHEDQAPRNDFMLSKKCSGHLGSSIIRSSMSIIDLEMTSDPPTIDLATLKTVPDGRTEQLSALQSIQTAGKSKKRT